MLYPKIPGESAQDRGVRIVRDMAGCSLLKNRDKLTRFVARDGAESKPEDVVQWETNCAEFGVSYLAALAGSLEDARKLCALLALPIRNGQAFSVLVQIGDKLGAWCPAPKKGEPVPRAAIIWYEIDGTNDDHAEISLDPPDEHGGGGRAHNEITIAHGDEHESWSRPIHKILDITKIKFDLPGLAAIARVEASTAETVPAPAPASETVPGPLAATKQKGASVATLIALAASAVGGFIQAHPIAVALAVVVLALAVYEIVRRVRAKKAPLAPSTP